MLEETLRQRTAALGLDHPDTLLNQSEAEKGSELFIILLR
jgi:hypothetical protein